LLVFNRQDSYGSAHVGTANIDGLVIILVKHSCVVLMLLVTALLLDAEVAMAEILVEKTMVEKAVVEKVKNDIENDIENVVQKECARIGHKLGSVSVQACVASNMQDSGGRSVHHQAILLKEYPPLLKRRKPIGRVLVIGGTHGDEYASVSVVFKWMQTLDQYHSGLFHWHVVPLLNPDGLLLSHPSVRLNAHGVDLNRNMPTPDWYRKTAMYWQESGKDIRRYPGTAPLSEPESTWLYEEIRHFQPDAIITVHAPYGLLDFDGPAAAPQHIGYLNLKLLGVFPGSLGNSAGQQHDIPVITIELPSAGSMPSHDQISAMWMDLVHWLRYNIPKQVTTKSYRSFDAVSDKLMASSPLSDADKVEIAAMPIASKSAISAVNINHVMDDE